MQLSGFMTHPYRARSAVDPMWTDAKRRRAEGIDALAARAFHVDPITDDPDPEADVEEWFELAARVDALVHAVGEENAWLGGFRSSSKGLLAPVGGGSQRRTVDDFLALGDAAFRYGMTVENRVHDTRGNEFMSHPSAVPWLRRPTALGLIPEYEEDKLRGASILPFLVQLHEAGHSHAVLKTVENKTAFAIIPTCATEDEQFDAIMGNDDLSWTVIRLGGVVDAWYAQAQIPMRFEYRNFVVNGETVTGAGCIEEHTPLDAAGDFDDRVRENRGTRGQGGTRSDIIRRPDLPSRFADAASEIARGLGTPDIVVDLALDDEEEIILVETNSIGDSGLYASEPRNVAAALADRARRRMERTG